RGSSANWPGTSRPDSTASAIPRSAHTARRPRARRSHGHNHSCFSIATSSRRPYLKNVEIAPGQPFASASAYLEAEFDHYRLQLKRLFRLAGHSLDEWPPDTHVPEHEIRNAFAGAAPDDWAEVAASRAQLDGRLMATLSSGLFIPITSLVKSFALT